MASLRRRTSLMLAGLLVTAPVAAALSACSSAPAEPAGCQSGAESSVQAVEILLGAADAKDNDAACRVTPQVSADVLASNLAEISTFITESGGIKKVTATEIVEKQLGRGHIVEVTRHDAPEIMEFMVYDEDGRFLVGISDPETEELAGETPTTTP